MGSKLGSVISLSGGMDSATLLAMCQASALPNLAVSFDYGSKHAKYEQECVRELCKHYSVELIQINLRNVGGLLSSNLLLQGGDIPEGHYEDESMKLTVVPGRNMIFISILTGIAQSRGAGEVALGIHAGDHAIYPDCRPEFFNSMKQTIAFSTEGQINLVAPFLDMNKISILKWGIDHSVPYQFTRTCYKNQPISCGKCGACQERLEAFLENDQTDPITYQP